MGASTTAPSDQELGKIFYFHSQEPGELNIDAPRIYLSHVNMTAPGESADQEVAVEPGTWMFVLMAAVFFLVLKFGQKKPHIQKTEVQEKTKVEEKSD